MSLDVFHVRLHQFLVHFSVRNNKAKLLYLHIRVFLLDFFKGFNGRTHKRGHGEIMTIRGFIAKIKAINYVLTVKIVCELLHHEHFISN